MLAKEVMVKDVVTVTGETTLEEVARIFIDRNISGMPVVDENDRIVGVISEGDLVYQQKPVTPPLFINLFDGILQVDRKDFWEEISKMAAYQVKDLMNKHVISAHEDTSVNEIASLMINKKVNRIPIVDNDNHVLGIITRHDIIRNVYL